MDRYKNKRVEKREITARLTEPSDHIKNNAI